MNVNYIYKRVYKNGLYDYTDADGNIIDEKENYTSEEQYYIDTTPEERAADKAAAELSRAEIARLIGARGKMFIRNELHYTPSPLRGTPPTLGGEFTRQPLWGKYWADKELCVLAGDTGVGKTLLALQIAKHLCGGRVMGVDDNIGRPRTVLYIDFELDKDDFYTRFGADHTLEHMHWAGFNRSGKRPGHLESSADWLLNTLDDYLFNNAIDAIIIDQPDRLHLTQEKWDRLMFKLKEITRTKNVGIMVIVNTKPRNYSRPLELSHIYNHRRLSFDADSIIAIGADYKNGALRYIKPLKIKNRPLWRNEKLQGFMIESLTLNPSPKERDLNAERHDGFGLGHTEHETINPDTKSSLPNNSPTVPYETPKQYRYLSGRDEGPAGGFILKIFLTAPCDEEEYLKPPKGKIREQKMIAAESMRKDGMYIDDIAIELGVPEGTVKRWVAGIKEVGLAGRGAGSIAAMQNPLPNRSDNYYYSDEEEEDLPLPTSHLREESRNIAELSAESFGPYVNSNFDFYAKPDSLTDDEWAVCVNNPASHNYDPFAYNPYLVEREGGE